MLGPNNGDPLKSKHSLKTPNALVTLSGTKREEKGIELPLAQREIESLLCAVIEKSGGVSS